MTPIRPTPLSLLSNPLLQRVGRYGILAVLTFWAPQPARALTGWVTTPEGHPVRRASVYVCPPQHGVFMQEPGQALEAIMQVDKKVTDREGRFELGDPADSHSLVVVAPTGCFQSPLTSLPPDGRIQLQPWGRIEGRLLIGDLPGRGQHITLQNQLFLYGYDGRPFPPLILNLSCLTDEEGRFRFDRVPPGEVRVFHHLNIRSTPVGEAPLSQGLPVRIDPGQTAAVTLGGIGRPIIGRLSLEGVAEGFDWSQDIHQLRLQIPQPDRPGTADTPEGEREFLASEAGREWQRAQRVYVPVLAPDGSFRIDDVPPGEYRLKIRLTDPDEHPNPMRRRNRIGQLDQLVRVPEGAIGEPGQPGPLDLGTLRIQARTRTEP